MALVADRVSHRPRGPLLVIESQKASGCPSVGAVALVLALLMTGNGPPADTPPG